LAEEDFPAIFDFFLAFIARGGDRLIGYLWAALICLSILTAAIRGDMAVITPAIFIAAERGVKVAFGLIER